MVKAVKGMNDIFGTEGYRWQRMEEDIRHIVFSQDFEEIRTPLVEKYELFDRSVGEDSDVVQKEMYDFKDKKGRHIALRPEGTAGIVRAYVEHRMDLEKPGPRKLFYFGPFFRYERPQKGRYRQFHQFGLEIFGDSTAEMDAEMIFTASRIMKHFEIDHDIKINSIGCDSCRPAYREKLKTFFEKHVDELCENCRNRLHTNPLRLIDCKKCEPFKRYDAVPLTTDHICDSCNESFEKLKKSLEIFKVSYKIDPSVVRGLDYYTKTAFEITADTDGAHNSIAGGGRYDSLVKELGGPDTPATGFAIGLERLFDLISDDFFAGSSLCSAYTLDESATPDLLHFVKHMTHHPLRITADYIPRKMGKALKKADKINARHIFMFGKHEVENKTVLYRDLKTGEQRHYKQHEVMKIVKDTMEKEIRHLSK
ncbi:MAG: histidine--tRNA ligase [bacterium]